MKPDETAGRLLAEVSEKMIEKPIETARTLVRPFRDEDFNDFFAFAVQKEQQRLSGNPAISAEKEARELFEALCHPRHPPRSFAIELKGIGTVIGDFSISVHPSLSEDEALRDKRGVTLSCALNEDYWRRGIMTEILRRAIPWYFEEAGLEYINTGYFTFNEGSERLQKKVGMKPYREHLFERDGLRIPTREMILFREDYLAEWKAADQGENR